MAKGLVCYGDHKFNEECLEFCDGFERDRCYKEKQLESLKVKTSWLQPASK